MNRFAVACTLSTFLLSAPLFAQSDTALLLRNVSGTTANPGTQPAHVISEHGAWTFFHSFDAHVTYVSETGPEEQRDEVFSTNYLTAGVQRTLGSRGVLILRGRVSAEPFTIPDDDGYPQLLQYVSFESGGQLVDRMRAHDLIGEAAAQLAFRTSTNSYLHVYAAAVGDPALGAAPYQVRASSIDFAEAPYGYDIQEFFHDSTSVITAGFTSNFFSIEGSVFHDAVTTGDHTEIDDGDIDSRSARLTITPSRNVAFQISRGELGDEPEQRTVTSASISWTGGASAVTAMYTRREDTEDGPAYDAFGFELALRASKNTFLARVENVDRPTGLFRDVTPSITPERTTHFTVGYIFDVLNHRSWRAGAGANIDYHTNTHDLSERYGHKPQAIYAFVRIRTN
ncbi:MAG TPA: hypothetical protein VFN10_16635 [Thermoanaerobaculia bacterium]|nr:hypothetical protein [Thermoanaerobaculia bacterium]